MKNDFKTTITSSEEEELSRLQSFVAKTRADTASVQSTTVQLSTDVQLLQDTLQHLEHRIHRVEDRLTSLKHPDHSSKILQHDLSALNTELEALDSQFQEIDKKIDVAAQQRRQYEEAAEATRRKALQSTRVVQDEKDVLDKAHNAKLLLHQKKEDAQAKIRRLGVIPPDIDRYSAMSVSKLMNVLKSANEELKKYGHVNKKALDQYSALTETRTDLDEKRQSLEKELESINHLMRHLDQQKGEAIERTYKQVQYQFETVFGELVGTEGCHAELQMVPNTDRKVNDPFLAVRIRVSFGLGAPSSELSQLSGGQKSLVALSLIFAIQRSDPAPFYLFDEIDAALDAEYRTSVARMLQRQSEGCQFLTASFKTEMVEAADRVYGIFFSNKVSRIHAISQDEGLHVLKQAAADDRKRNRGQMEQELRKDERE